MKTLSILIILIVITCNPLYSKLNDWEFQDNYYELKVHDNPVKYAKISYDKKSVFTSDFQTIKKWDLISGKLLETKTLPEKDIEKISISLNENYYSILKKDSYIILNYSFKTDSLINYFNCKDLAYAPFGASQWLIDIEYSPVKDDELIICSQYSACYGSSNSTAGLALFLNITTDSITSFHGGGYDISVSGDLKYMLSAYSYFNTTSESQGGHVSSGAGLKLLSQINEYKPQRLYSSSHNNSIRTAFSNANTEFAANIGTLLYLYDLEEEQEVDSMVIRYFNEKGIQIAFTYNDNFIAVSTIMDSIGIIKFLDYKNKIFVDTIYFPKNVEVQFIPYQDKNRMLCYCSDGYLRLIQPDLLKDEMNAHFATDNICYEPFETIQFNNYSSDVASSYYWMFGDGFTSKEENPTHFYTKSGEYDVTLIATDGASRSTFQKNKHVFIRELPVADFTFDTNYCVYPMDVNFTDHSENEIDDWYWDFGNGDYSTEQNPSYTFNEPGLYKVTLYVSNECYSDSYTRELYVNRVKSVDLGIEFEREYSGLTGLNGFESGSGKYIVNGAHQYRVYFNEGWNIGWDDYTRYCTYQFNNNEVLWIQDTVKYGTKPFKYIYGSSDSSYYSLPYMVHFDNNGDSTEYIDNRVLAILEPQSDGICYIKGEYQNYYGDSCYLYRTGANGSLLWKVGLNSTNSSQYLYQGVNILELLNGDLITAINDSRNRKCKLSMVSKNGIIINQFNASNYDSLVVTGLVGLADNSYIVSGFNENCAGRITRYDAENSIIWDKSYLENYDSLFFYDILKINDNYFAVAGCFDGFAGFMILDVDGNIVEDYKFLELPGYFCDITMNHDNSLFILGNYYINEKRTKIITIKTEPLDSNIYKTSVKTKDDNIQLTIYPNPVNNELTIVLPEDSFNLADLQVFNSYGNQVAGLNNLIIEDQRIKINTAALLPGIYYFKISSAGQAYSGKFVVVR